jgi:hypothetical protein
MLTVTAVIVVVCGVLIALYAYLNRPTTVLLIVVMGVLVWLIHYFVISSWYIKRKVSST